MKPVEIRAEDESMSISLRLKNPEGKPLSENLKRGMEALLQGTGDTIAAVYDDERNLVAGGSSRAGAFDLIAAKLIEAGAIISSISNRGKAKQN